MFISRPLLTFGVITMVTGALIGVGAGFFFGCEYEWCAVTQWQRERLVTSFSECVVYGHPVNEAHPRSCTTPGGKVFAEGSSVSSKGNSSFPDQTGEVNVIVTEPEDGAIVGTTIAVHGEARVFENVVSYRLRDEDGSVLQQGTANANSPDVGQFGLFSFTIDASGAKGKRGIVEVFQASAKDGSDIDVVRVRIVFGKGS